jgi:hypothetical protein
MTISNFYRKKFFKKKKLIRHNYLKEFIILTIYLISIAMIIFKTIPEYSFTSIYCILYILYQSIVKKKFFIQYLSIVPYVYIIKK